MAARDVEMRMREGVMNRGRVPVLLIVGIGGMAAVMGLHFASVFGWSGGTRVEFAAELVRANVTPLAWCFYLLILLGGLGLWDGRSWLWRYWDRFCVCWLWSVPAWCYFDWMNFYFMRDKGTGLRAWEYINMPRDFSDRILGYLLAFGAIAPGMFLTAEVLQRAGLWRFFVTARKIPGERGGRQAERAFAVAIFLLGVVLAPIPIVVGGPASNLAIWVGTWALLDPVNWALGRPSIVGDWLAGRFGRTFALALGGLACGFLWEFWNYWAGTKWVYHLPFLGAWERVKFFEMPVAGLIGFIAFGIETWTMWQTALLILWPVVEGERGGEGDRWVREFGCV